jgi:hypothetical protein
MTKRVTYTGSPRLASAVAQMLEEEGVEVTYTPPTEQRDLSTMAQAVTVYFFCKGSEAAIAAALRKYRERFGGGGSFELDSDDGSDD